MATVQILLLEHDDVEGLYPFTDTHCSWEIRTGHYTILERWTKSLPGHTVSVVSHRDLHLRSFVERHPETPAFVQAPTLLVASHVLLSPEVMRRLVTMCESSTETFLVACSGLTVGAFVSHELATPHAAVEVLDALSADQCSTVECAGHIIRRLWQTLDHIDLSIVWDAELVDQLISQQTSIHPSAVLDDSMGPILIADGVRIEPLAVITGPASIGKDTIVMPHATLDTVAIGPVCRVGGEISSSIIQGYTNKRHDGFLGHSYIGEWVNLGAATTTSNLKNTYGNVRVTFVWGTEDSQRMFLGLLMGDHSKAAIGTRFPTGTVCGTSCNIVRDGFTDNSIGSFRWLDESYDIEKAIAVIQTSMGRRSRSLGPATEALLRYLAG